MEKDDISISEFLYAIWKNKLIVIIITSIFGYFSVNYALSLPDIYKSTVLLAPNQKETKTGALGALARLTGADVKIDDDYNKVEYASALLFSNEFLAKFIIDKNLKAEIMAAKSFDKVSKKLIYDDTNYDFKENKWTKPKLTNFEKNLRIVKSKFGLTVKELTVFEPTILDTVYQLQSMMELSKNKKRFYYFWN